MGIKTVIIPQGNAREIEELPKVLKHDVHFVPVSDVDEVFALVLENGELGARADKPKTVRKPKNTKVVPPMGDTHRDGVRC